MPKSCVCCSQWRDVAFNPNDPKVSACVVWATVATTPVH
jgi:hypothetical protein